MVPENRADKARAESRMDGEFRTSFVREPNGLRHHPALVLNADYRPLSYYPLSLWPWQDAVKAAFLDRVDIVAEYDQVVRSPSIEIRIPSVVVLKFSTTRENVISNTVPTVPTRIREVTSLARPTVTKLQSNCAMGPMLLTAPASPAVPL